MPPGHLGLLPAQPRQLLPLGPAQPRALGRLGQGAASAPARTGQPILLHPVVQRVLLAPQITRHLRTRPAGPLHDTTRSRPDLRTERASLGIQRPNLLPGSVSTISGEAKDSPPSPAITSAGTSGRASAAPMPIARPCPMPPPTGKMLVAGSKIGSSLLPHWLDGIVTSRAIGEPGSR